LPQSSKTGGSLTGAEVISPRRRRPEEIGQDLLSGRHWQETFSPPLHRLTNSTQSKEDTAMKHFGTGAGDVDDLIFQDCWMPSDR
jgi:hypothetical protein